MSLSSPRASIVTPLTGGAAQALHCLEGIACQGEDPSHVWYQDTDLLLALRRAGRPPVLVRESRIRHALSQIVASEDPELSARIRAQVARDHDHGDDQFLSKHPDAVLRDHALGA